MPTYASTKRADAKAATRAKIVAAAGKLFAEKGYDAVPIRDVATTAGVSTGAIFASFEGKDALFEAATGAPAPKVHDWLAMLCRLDSDYEDAPFPDAEALLRKLLAQARGLRIQLLGRSI